MILGVVGDIVQDVVVFTQAPFAPGSDTPSRITWRRGGSAANVAAAAASLTPTRFIGCVGDDPMGRQLASSLPGVDVLLQTTVEAPTGTIAVVVGQDGERHMFPDRGANACLTALDPAWLDGLAVLHATAYSLAGGTTAKTVTDSLRQAAAKGVVTSLDASSVALIEQIGASAFTDLVDDLAPALVFANAAEATALGWSEPSPTHQWLVIVKDGGRPALVRTPRGAWTVPTTPLEASDTTGAGDAFAAGVLASIVNKGLTREDLQEIGEAQAVELGLAGHLAAADWLRHQPVPPTTSRPWR